MRSFLVAFLLCGQAYAQGNFPPPAFDPAESGNHEAVFAGGCFWGMQGVFQHVKGVVSATAGYAGGSADSANYDAVSTGTTGHAESVRVIYDASKISYGRLLEIFFSVAHDPTKFDRQGPDEGPQYRSEIFSENAGQMKVAKTYIDQLSRAHVYPEKIETKVDMLPAFYPAEKHHQDFALNHPHYPYIVVNDLPKITHLRQEFPGLYSEKPAPY